MDNLLELVATTLQRGCGIELKTLTSSKEFRSRVCERTIVLEQLRNSDSDEATALRAGHLEFGELINALPEAQALQQAQPEGDTDPYLSVLFEMVGEKLLATAAECMPARARELAPQFAEADANQQLVFLDLVFECFSEAYEAAEAAEKEAKKKDKAPEEPTLTIDNGRVMTLQQIREIAEYYRVRENQAAAEEVDEVASWLDSNPMEAPDPAGINRLIDYVILEAGYLSTEGWLYAITEEQLTPDRVLPREYGVYGASATKPSCLGMSLMLAAFARATTLPVMVVNPLRMLHQLQNSVVGQQSQLVLNHYNRMEVEDFEYREKLRQAVTESKSIAKMVQDFHYSVAIQLSDGRWAHLDPYSDRCGVFGPEWELDRLYEMLTKYRETLPGLTLFGDDAGHARRWEARWLDRFDEILGLAERLVQVLSQWPFEIMTDLQDGEGEDRVPIMGIKYDEFAWIMDELNNSGEIDELICKLVEAIEETNPEFFQFDLEDKALRIFMDMQKVSLDQEKEDEPDRVKRLTRSFAANSVLFGDDPEYWQECIHELSISIAGLAVDAWNKWITTKGLRSLDPVMQFSLPEYNQALAVVSHVRCWTRPDVPGRLFLGLSSNQIFWHEAVDLSDGVESSDADHPEVVRAEAMVRALPPEYQHAACDRKLTYLSRTRAERNANG